MTWDASVEGNTMHIVDAAVQKYGKIYILVATNRFYLNKIVGEYLLAIFYDLILHRCLRMHNAGAVKESYICDIIEKDVLLDYRNNKVSVFIFH